MSNKLLNELQEGRNELCKPVLKASLKEKPSASSTPAQAIDCKAINKTTVKQLKDTEGKLKLNDAKKKGSEGVKIMNVREGKLEQCQKGQGVWRMDNQEH